MKASFTLRAYLMSEDTRKSAMKNKKQRVSSEETRYFFILIFRIIGHIAHHIDPVRELDFPIGLSCSTIAIARLFQKG